MRTFILIFLVLFFAGCELNVRVQTKTRYSVGETVFLKPDSTKCTITGTADGDKYAVRYFDKNGVVHEIPNGGYDAWLKETDFY